MDSVKKIAIGIVAMLVLSAIGVYAFGAIVGQDTVESSSADIPEQQEHSVDDDASTQLDAALSALYYEDHRQEVSAELRASDSDPSRVIEGVTLVSHSSEQMFSGTQVERNDGSFSLQYRYVDTDVGGVAEGGRDQALDTPPNDGWETTDARYFQSAGVPSINSDADWRVKSENDSRVVLEVTGEDEYIDAMNSSAFDELSEESYIQVHIDVESGQIVKIVDRQVGYVEEDDGSVRGPLVFHREITFDYGTVELERPDTLEE